MLIKQIAEQAANDPKRVFYNLAHKLDVDFLREAFFRLKKQAATGVDGVTFKEYIQNLEENLEQLHQRLKSDKYRAQPAKRVWLEKEDGSQRPISIQALEDKIVQRAVVMLLNPIYEQDFYDFSYGFRQEHSAHQALKSLRDTCMENNIRWIAEFDISKFFDTLDRGVLRDLLKKRVADGSIIKLIGKWLNAGVMEGEQITHPTHGVAQGAIISPLLANVYLHYVLDDWFIRHIKGQLKGKCFLFRFADDFVFACEFEEDARLLLELVTQRFAEFKLTIHPDKSSIVYFAKPSYAPGSKASSGTFDFLGFTHFWSKSLRGYWVIKRKTMKKRLKRAVRSIWSWCRFSRHMHIDEQHATLSAKLRGHYNYYGVTCNFEALKQLYLKAERAWKYWLSRRGHKGNIDWDKFREFLKIHSLPRPKIVHSI